MRIAHFSDPHLLDVSSATLRDFASAKVLAGSLNVVFNRARKHRTECFAALVDDLNAQDLDHVVCTGDLVNLGLRPEFQRAAELLGRIRLGPAGVTLVPGNHDYYTAAAMTEQRFERALGAYATGDGQTRPDYPFLRLRDDLAVAGLCSAYASPLGLADGRLGPAQLRAAEALLTRVEVRERFRLVLVHHPPVVHRGWFARNLRDREALQAMLARAGADLVLHGHDHHDERAAIPGPGGSIPVIGVGSASYDDWRLDRAARYHVFEIAGRKLVRVTTRVWDRDADRFRELV
ncbi:MAG: metallophosphoesterase [Deltaproteobacteria bacterium]|nr:metallophosphoesterase [Deltaproteobacteria bacterium]